MLALALVLTLTAPDLRLVTIAGRPCLVSGKERFLVPKTGYQWRPEGYVLGWKLPGGIVMNVLDSGHAAIFHENGRLRGRLDFETTVRQWARDKARWREDWVRTTVGEVTLHQVLPIPQSRTILGTVTIQHPSGSFQPPIAQILVKIVPLPNPQVTMVADLGMIYDPPSIVTPGLLRIGRIGADLYVVSPSGIHRYDEASGLDKPMAALRKDEIPLGCVGGKALAFGITETSSLRLWRPTGEHTVNLQGKASTQFPYAFTSPDSDLVAVGGAVVDSRTGKVIQIPFDESRHFRSMVWKDWVVLREKQNVRVFDGRTGKRVATFAVH